jgi:hypothetical protein
MLKEYKMKLHETKQSEKYVDKRDKNIVGGNTM